MTSTRNSITATAIRTVAVTATSTSASKKGKKTKTYQKLTHECALYALVTLTVHLWFFYAFVIIVYVGCVCERFYMCRAFIYPISVCECVKYLQVKYKLNFNGSFNLTLCQYATMCFNTLTYSHTHVHTLYAYIYAHTHGKRTLILSFINVNWKKIINLIINTFIYAWIFYVRTLVSASLHVYIHIYVCVCEYAVCLFVRCGVDASPFIAYFHESFT